MNLRFSTDPGLGMATPPTLPPLRPPPSLEAIILKLRNLLAAFDAGLGALEAWMRDFRNMQYEDALQRDYELGDGGRWVDGSEWDSDQS